MEIEWRDLSSISDEVKCSLLGIAMKSAHVIHMRVPTWVLTPPNLIQNKNTWFHFGVMVGRGIRSGGGEDDQVMTNWHPCNITLRFVPTAVQVTQPMPLNPEKDDGISPLFTTKGGSLQIKTTTLPLHTLINVSSKSHPCHNLRNTNTLHLEKAQNWVYLTTRP